MKIRKEKLQQIISELASAQICIVKAMNHNRDLQKEVKKELQKLGKEES